MGSETLPSEGGSHAMVSPCRLFFWRRFFRQCYSTLHQRRVRASVPNPIRFPARQGAVFGSCERALGSLNLVIGYLLVFRVGTFDFRRTQDTLIVGVGGLLMAVMLSRAFAGIGREGGK